MARLMASRALAAAIAVAFCFGAIAAKPKARANPNAALILRARSALAERMKDPASLQTRRISVHRGSDGMVVCGEVNARNSYGGYVGFQRFVYGAGVALLEDDQEYGQLAIGCYE
jgi:hypothetical protein